MKVLVRDKSKNLYLAQGGRWVAEPDHGQDFQGCKAAIDHVFANRLTGVDLWCVFPNSDDSFTLPLDAHESPDALLTARPAD